MKASFSAVIAAVLWHGCRCRGPVFDGDDGLRHGHAFDPHQPVEPAAAFTAAEAIKMIRIDRARRLGVVVERAGDFVVGGQRQADQLGQRGDVVRQVGDEVLVVLAFDQGRIVDRTDDPSRVSSI